MQVHISYEFDKKMIRDMWDIYKEKYKIDPTSTLEEISKELELDTETVIKIIGELVECGDINESEVFDEEDFNEEEDGDKCGCDICNCVRNCECDCCCSEHGERGFNKSVNKYS